MEETKTQTTKKTVKDILIALGRRKTATARVKLNLNEKGNIEVNGMRIEEYFPGELNQAKYLEPLRTCNVIGKYKIDITVNGSGKDAQMGAVIHGLSRVLVKLDSEKFKSILKKRNFLTRDSRVRQRRQAGMGGKSRRQRQSPRR
ncbi:30S ribosomal protein S9 [Candidatus Beckwithbacteria bacterium CG23_combo_of_CG06-09_8_20_14_all_34_8]|uniref:Small ribosomal subunit protein uS9 n=1 Tax=Candidatus Beckwithbacteria bacterium CG23_combo_of_CG06-09_8_20_14_all_34_8 TaxID=1974497 RepID=A0A2H0B6R2_9BACT|nr:MAG: 30S ribosomal protein S9 [Candidatus Beckwithbacteria bacterium CG23_combo_of_CG06-09_8_20_14_all_34_8]